MSWIQLVIILLVVVAPILKQAYDKIQEQKELQSRRRDQTLRERETLRTGRAPEAPRARPVEQDARSRLAQLEADRQARIRAMREATMRRQQTGAAQRQAGQPGAADEARRAQELAARRRAAMEAQQRQQQQQKQQQVLRQAQARAQRQQPAARPARLPTAPPIPPVQEQPEAAPRFAPLSERSSRPAVIQLDSAKVADIAGALHTPGGLRTALIMSEVLRPPLALRRDSDAGWQS